MTRDREFVLGAKARQPPAFGWVGGSCYKMCSSLAYDESLGVGVGRGRFGEIGLCPT